MGPISNSDRRPFRFYALLPVDSNASAREAAKAGAIAGFIAAAVNVVFFVATLMNYQLIPVTKGHDPHLIALGLEGYACALAVIMAFLAWRVLTCRGYISAMLLAILLALEVAFIFLFRHSGIVLVGFMLLKFVIDGVRGTWWLRRNPQTGADPDVFT